MLRYRLKPEGEVYIRNPERNEDGRITTTYFKNVIIMYIFEKEKYTPSDFKEYIEGLGILTDNDREQMTTRNYPVWKHYIDAAKQQLLEDQVLTKNEDGTFSISGQRVDEAYDRISGWVEPLLRPLEPRRSEEEEEYPPKKVRTTVLRTIRDTALSKEIKEKRNFKCQACGTALIIKGHGYAEAHHLRPLGSEGADTESNLLVLCPNCHVLFDYGGIAISPEDCRSIVNSAGEVIAVLTSPSPRKEYIEYHFNHTYST